MTSAVLDRTLWGAIILSVGLALLALVAIYSSMPSPHRAQTPPPIDRDGYTYTCYCYSDPVRVKILAPTKSRRAARHGRHARLDQPPQDHRIRPHHVSRAGADGGGKGGTVPVTVAA